MASVLTRRPLPPRRPQSPALPRQRGGGDPLPDGGRDSGHGVTEGVAPVPRSGAVLPGHGGGLRHQPHPQPGHHRRLQRPAPVEAALQFRPAGT